MNSRLFSGPELLEARIAPAGVIAATLDHGALSLIGSVASTDLLIQQVGSTTWALTGNAGTTILYNGAAAAPQVFISGITGDVTLAFDINQDTISFDRVKIPRNLTADLGNGTNLLAFADSSIGGSFSYTGGTGSDAISLLGERATIGGSATVNLADGGNSFGLGADYGSVGGDLTVTGGSVLDSFQLYGGAIKVKGSVSFDAGTAGASSIVINARSLEVAKNFTINDSDTGNIVEVSPRVSLKVGGKLTVDGHAGVDTINIGVGTVRVSAGSLEVITAADADADVVNIKPTGLLEVKVDLNLTSNGGGILNTITADVIRVGRDLNISDGIAGAAAVTDFVQVSSELTVGRSLVMGSSANSATHSVISLDRIKIGRDLYSSSTDRLLTGFAALQTDIKGTFSALGTNYSFLELEGTALRVKGDLVIDGPAGAGLEADLNSLSVGHDLKMTATSETLSLDLDLARTLTIGHDLALTHSGTTLLALIATGSGRIGGSILIDATTTGAITQSFVGELGKLQIVGVLSLIDAASGGSDTVLANLSVGGLTTFTSGAATDKLHIDDSTFGGTVTINTAGGADSVLIEQIASVTRGSTLFKNDVSISTDSGSDILTIGQASDPFRVAFKKNATFDGGTNSDPYTVAPAPYVTFISGQPSVTEFP